MSIEVLQSGRHRAVIMVDGNRYRQTFDTRRQAEQWETRARRDIHLGLLDSPGLPQAAVPEPEPATPLFAAYATDWLAHRPLKASTRGEYQRMLDKHLVPAFGPRALHTITTADVRDWHRTLLPDAPTRRAHAYALLRAILNTAVAEDVLTANPCKVKGAGQAKRAGRTEVPTVEQLGALVAAMPQGKYRTMTLIAAWCGLRFGELVELRRKDVVAAQDGTPVAFKIRRAFYKGVVASPKSDAGVRDVSIPPHIRPQVREYLDKRPKAADRLLFEGYRSSGHMQPSSLHKQWHKARKQIPGMESLRWHDLRHWSATTAAQTGASLAELQRRLGHSTVNAAMRYQHAAHNRDAEVAEAMSRIADPGGNVVPIRRAAVVTDAS